MTKTYKCVTAATTLSVGLSFYLAVSGQLLASALSLVFAVPAVFSWAFFTYLEFKDYP